MIDTAPAASRTSSPSTFGAILTSSAPARAAPDRSRLNAATATAQSIALDRADNACPNAEQIHEAARIACGVHNVSDPASIQHVSEELVLRFSVYAARDAVLVDATSFVPWFAPEARGTWQFYPRYETYCLNHHSPIAVGAVDVSTDWTLSNLADPKSSVPLDRRGLVVGHVQSGKTGHYIALANKALDEGYKLVIILAGVHNSLRSQTQIRVDEGIIGYAAQPHGKSSLPTGPIGAGIYGPTLRPQCATSRIENGDFSPRNTTPITPESKPWLFVVKKNATVLRNLLDWFGNTDLRALPILVIDDEADHSSVDTEELEFDADGTPSEEHQPKKINSLIRQILQGFDVKSYVGYTATPFANVFIHREAETELEGPDLFPKSFIQNVSPPSNYAGAIKTFGAPSPEGREGALPIHRAIADIGEAGSWMPQSHDKSHLPLFHGQEAIPDSLRMAILGFILSISARSSRGQREAHSSMLVHATRFANVQSNIKDQIARYAAKLKKDFASNIPSAMAPHLAALQKLWESDFEPTTVLVAALDVATAALPPLGWDDIAPFVKDSVLTIEVKLINGTAKDALDYSARASGKPLRVIAVGGEKLSRGLTLDGLCSSYFARTTKTYDTLMQMARWFGYRDGYLDLCRLHTPPELVEYFCHIADASEELRESFEQMTQRGATPDEYGLRVASHPILTITAAAKMRTARNCKLNLSGTLLETVTMHNDPAVLDRNLLAVDRLVNTLRAPAMTNFAFDRCGAKHEFHGHLWRGADPLRIADFLRDFATHPAALKVDSPAIAEFIEKMAGIGALDSFDVAMLGVSSGSIHRFSNGLDSPPMSERRARAVSGTPRYSFGRLMSPRDETIQLGDAAYAHALKHTPPKFDDGKLRPAAKPNGPAIRRTMGFGAPGIPANSKRATLFLYPLDPQLASPELFPGRNAPVMAFGISFPDSDAGVKVDYVVDHLTWEQNHA